VSDEEPVVLPLGREFDLHTFRQNEIPLATREYLEEARRLGFLQVRIIHGKGTGYQREVVRSILSQTPFVESFGDDMNGNRGATWAYLKAP
jgi:dsDNA-specific endonuclease/ATPase MutS2